MDLAKPEAFQGQAGSPAPGKFMKNSREQWKYDFHRPAVMGDQEAKTLIQHEVQVPGTQPQ